MNENIKSLIEKVGTDVSGKWMSVDKVEELVTTVAHECILLVDKSDVQHCAFTTHDLGTAECAKQKIVTAIKNQFNIKNNFGVFK